MIEDREPSLGDVVERKDRTSTCFMKRTDTEVLVFCAAVPPTWFDDEDETTKRVKQTAQTSF